jgi:hypothetical protein
VSVLCELKCTPALLMMNMAVITATTRVPVCSLKVGVTSLSETDFHNSTSV